MCDGDHTKLIIVISAFSSFFTIVVILAINRIRWYILERRSERRVEKMIKDADCTSGDPEEGTVDGI